MASYCHWSNIDVIALDRFDGYYTMIMVVLLGYDQSSICPMTMSQLLSCNVRLTSNPYIGSGQVHSKV